MQMRKVPGGKGARHERKGEKNMKKLLAIMSAMLMVVSLLAGCGGAPASGSGAGTSSGGYELALVTDIGTIDDKSFNQGSWEGLVKYAEEKGISHQYYKPTEKSTDAYLSAIDLAVKGGAKVIVCPGFLFQEPVQIAMETYPDVTFIAIDCTLENPAENAIGITYAEDQVGFLAGYAAVKDGMTNLGYMGGMAVPAVQKYGFGFLQGAEYAAQELGMEPGSITVKYHYTGGFDATPEAKAMAASWYKEGAEVIFAAGGAVGNSVMAAAEEAGTKVIGVDVDQSGESNTVITSAMKGLAESVNEALTDSMNNGWKFTETYAGKETKLGAAENCVGLPMETSKFNKFTQEQYDAMYASIVDGTLTIDDSFDITVTPSVTNVTVDYQG